MYAVQKDVPIPKAVVARAASARRQYPFDQMDINDMFFIPNRSKNNMTTQASMAGKSLGRKFTTRLTHMHEVSPGVWELCDPKAPDAVQGIGVWRAA